MPTVPAHGEPNGHRSPVPIRRQRGRPRTTALAPMPAADPADRHPAYQALYDAHCFAGGSIAAAHAMVTEFWDEARQGSLPDVRTVQRWAQADQWDARWLREIQERGDKQTALVNLALQQLQLLAVRGARDILLEQGNPKFAVAKRGVFRDVMWLTGAGILQNRYGAVDTSAAREVPDDEYADDALTVAELIERETREYQAARARGERP